MTARFPDHKALVFAYSDLLDQGIPASAMRAAFDRPPAMNKGIESRRGALDQVPARLRTQWSRQEKSQTPPRTCEQQGGPTGALLHVDADGREQAASEVIEHHFGVVIA